MIFIRLEWHFVTEGLRTQYSQRVRERQFQPLLEHKITAVCWPVTSPGSRLMKMLGMLLSIIVGLIIGVRPANAADCVRDTPNNLVGHILHNSCSYVVVTCWRQARGGVSECTKIAPGGRHAVAVSGALQIRSCPEA